MGTTTMDLGSSVEHVNSETWYLVYSQFQVYFIVDYATLSIIFV